MGYRLSRIYTRTGDKGTTGLGDGSRVPKDHPRIECCGEIDELNSALGVVLTKSLPDDLRTLLTEIQHDLFDLGGELSIPGHSLVPETRIDWLEKQLDRLNEELHPLEEFILPGGSEAAACTHLARSICRRAERRLVALQREEPGQEIAGRYLNRLSDLLFVVARYLNQAAGTPDVLWNRKRQK